MIRIAVCGLGKLGLPIASVFAKFNYHVIGLDLDEKKVEDINAGCSPIEEPGLQKLIQNEVLNGTLRATTNAALAVAESDACIFVTPTPSLSDGKFDSAFLLKAMDTVSKLVSRSGYLFIVTSTVTPGTCQGELIPLLASNLLSRRIPFHLVYKPEFIALGTVIRDLEFPDVHLLGQSSPEAGMLAAKLYCPEKPQLVRRMSLIEAELAKISLNSFVTMKISFANQLAMIADEYNADPHEILDAIGQDRRVGQAALKPGLPYGGPCFPRDNRLFQYASESVGVRAPLAAATDAINNRVVDLIVLKVLEYERERRVPLQPIHYLDVGILGTAYKPGTAIIEESAATRIAKLLLGRTIKTHDPMAPHSHSLEDVLACPILIVATPWPEYAALKFSEDTALIDPMRVIKTRYVPLERKAAV